MTYGTKQMFFKEVSSILRTSDQYVDRLRYCNSFFVSLSIREIC